MSVAELLPFVGVVSLAIASSVIVYHFGKWRQKNDSDREEMRRKIDELCLKVDKIPEELLSKSIDMYKMWEKMNDDSTVNSKNRKPVANE
ncbi:MAG: hypothetical protein ACBZ72_00355 [Candidatus Bathyarchaeia archaeon]|jgi:hypothetical protein